MTKFDTWYVIDEDNEEVITTIYGTEEDAHKVYDAVNEARKPSDQRYWHTWTLVKRCAA
jgi:hypothetical protein